jgi:hypothetical protein
MNGDERSAPYRRRIRLELWFVPNARRRAVDSDQINEVITNLERVGVQVHGVLQPSTAALLFERLGRFESTGARTYAEHGRQPDDRSSAA